MVASSTSGEKADTVNMVFVNAPAGLTQAEQTRLKNFISVRLDEPNLTLTLNPASFPWPSSR